MGADGGGGGLGAAATRPFNPDGGIETHQHNEVYGRGGEQRTSITGSAGLSARRSAAARRRARAASGMSNQDCEDASALSTIADARVYSHAQVPSWIRSHERALGPDAGSGTGGKEHSGGWARARAGSGGTRL